MASKPTTCANSNSTMAASSSTTSAPIMAPSITSSVNLMNQPLLLLSNMANMMTVKLDNTNYIVWKHPITMVLETLCLSYWMKLNWLQKNFSRISHHNSQSILLGLEVKREDLTYFHELYTLSLYSCSNNELYLSNGCVESLRE